MWHSLVIPLSLAAVGHAMPEMKRQLVGFDPAAQHISTSGQHVWKAPGPNDVRGPCPGLNALANHGYLPRNGYTSITQAAQGIIDVYGLGDDFGVFLAVLAGIFAGDGLGFSIGGPPPPNLIAGGLLGRPLGISDSHNRFEGDASITRDDLYMTDDAHTINPKFFQQLIDLAAEQGKDNFDLDLLSDHNAARYNYSLFNNPYFFRGPVGALVPPGTAGLVAKLFSNKSAEYPEGYLNKANLMSFYGVTEDTDGKLNVQPGYERIPDNWYKNNVADPYTTLSFVTDTLQSYARNPQVLVFGGNTGTVNSMTPIDLGNLTGGVYNAKNIFEGNNLGCFIFQTIAAQSPDIIANGGVINDILGLINGKMQLAITNAISGLSCPQLAKYDDGQFNIFPGYTQYHSKTGDY